MRLNDDAPSLHVVWGGGAHPHFAAAALANLLQ